MHTSTRFRSPTAPNGNTLNTVRWMYCSSRVAASTVSTEAIRRNGSDSVTSHFASYVTEKLHSGARMSRLNDASEKALKIATSAGGHSKSNAAKMDRI